MKKSTFLIVYVLLAVLDLYAICCNQDIRPITKPLIMVALISYFLFNAQRSRFTSIGWIFGFSLLFALAGDVFLLFDNGFLFGLASFLLMQVGYSVVFLKGKNYLGKREIIYGLIVIVFLLADMSFLWPHLGSMKVPVLFYTAAIATMNLLAYSRDFTTPSYYAVFIGSLFFLASDTLLGVNSFVDSVHISGILVMLTYIIAQYLIVTGMANFLENQS